MNAFNDSSALAQSGMYIAGAKYMVIQGEAGVVIRGKKVLLHAVLKQLSLGRKHCILPSSGSSQATQLLIQLEAETVMPCFCICTRGWGGPEAIQVNFFKLYHRRDIVWY